MKKNKKGLKIVDGITIEMYDTDYILAITTGLVVMTCCLTTVLSVAFPCTCNPRRDCRRNCSECKRDRENCRRDCNRCCSRQRADTEEELVNSA